MREEGGGEKFVRLGKILTLERKIIQIVKVCRIVLS
jgi:hypothetical protein